MNDISYRVMRVNEFKDAVYYSVSCDCGDPEHIITIEICKDTPQFLDLNMYAKVVTSVYWGSDNWFKRLMKRIKISTTVLFKGWIELEETFLLRGEDHINSFIKALEEGKSKLNKEDENGKNNQNV